ncbi:TldD/PmbA family protein [bacterium]|nr:TldD/PmbA family protein [candidate division CSSED10-310 bacterium]
MKHTLVKHIQKSDADFTDAMFEETRSTTISFNKMEIQNVISTVIKGGRVTALKNGGYAGASFTAIENLDSAVRQACKSAKAMSVFDNTNRLFPAPVVEDDVKADMTTDPRTVDFDEKVRMARDYLSLVLSTRQVFTAFGSYNETDTYKTYVNSEGSRITQEIVQCYFTCRIMSKNGNTTESLGLALGFDSDYNRLLNRHDQVEKRANLAADLLKAEPIKPGVHRIIADQDLAGVFVHEAFGHLSESDDTVNNTSLQQLLVIGKPLGNPCMNIVDQGDYPHASGTYVYDDEGVRSRKTYLVKDGILSGRLFSRLTAHQLNGSLTGNYRACDYRFMPLVRMSNIYIENGKSTFDELLEETGSGYYLCGGKGGQTMGDLFTFGAQYGYEIQNGRLGKMVKDINISGNVFETLNNIVLVGNDFKMSEGGGCGKTRAGLFDMQMLDKSGTGGPSVLIKSVVIGG